MLTSLETIMILQRTILKQISIDGEIDEKNFTKMMNWANIHFLSDKEYKTECISM